MERRYLVLVCSLNWLIFAGTGRPVATHVSAEQPTGESENARLTLHAVRSSPLDLEVGGDVAGLAAGKTAFLSREELLALPQVTYNVDDDANFKTSTQISGVLLEVLSDRVSASPQSDLIIALCEDKYRANYPRSYVSGHHPILVMKINGKAPADWPKDSEGHGLSLGPYLISHVKFTPGFKILSHEDQAQIPWGVIRIDFRDEPKTFGAIAPRGATAQTKVVQEGYHIARQNCFRCHNMASEGGQKAGRSWLILSSWATASPEYFGAYIRNPKSKNASALMPGFPTYDEATLQALTAYFRTFSSEEKR